MWYSTDWQDMPKLSKTNNPLRIRDEWAPMSKMAAAITKHSGVIQSHIIRAAWRLTANKIDKLADKARASLFKRPDVVQWIEADAKNNNGALSQQLADFVNAMPSDAYKLLPWMWTQIKADPNLLTMPNDHQRMYEIGSAFHTLNRGNKPTPDIHRLTFPDAVNWLNAHETQAALSDLRPMQWEDPEHHFTASDGKHVVHRITNAADARQEGDVMGHCVGGYGDQIESGKTNIFSLRDEKHRPHVTVEMKPKNGGFQTDYGFKDGDRVVARLDGDRTILGTVAQEPNEQYSQYIRVRDDQGIMRTFGAADVTREDGTKPPRKQVKNPTTEHSVTQVFGKGDQAPIGKYRNMVREFFDDLRAKGHTLHWAGNEFLPEHVDTLSDAEEVWNFLDELHSHMGQQDEAPNTDPLGVAQSIVETGNMAHQYGFEGQGNSTMDVDWDALIEDFVEQSDSGYFDQDDAVNYIEAVAAIKGVPKTELRRLLNKAELAAQEKRYEREGDQRDSDRDHSWHEIMDRKQELLRDRIERDHHHVDHDSERAYDEDQYDKLHGEQADLPDEQKDWDDDDIHDAANDQYRDAQLDHEQEAEDDAQAEWEENWYADGVDNPADDAVHELRNRLSDGIESKTERVLDMAMNKNTSDNVVNEAWEDLMRTLAKSPNYYAKLTHSFPNLVRRAYQHAQNQVAATHDAQGWQQVMPKGEKPLYKTTERTDQLIEALEGLMRNVHADGGPDFSKARTGWGAGGVSRQDMLKSYLQDKSLHRPFFTQQAKPTTPSPSRFDPKPLTIQQDWVRQQEEEHGFLDSQSQPLRFGDQVRDRNGLIGTVKSPNAQGNLTIETPHGVNYLDQNGTKFELTKVSTWERTATDTQQMLDANRGRNLDGMPMRPVNVGGTPLTFHSHGGIQQIANEYNEQRGLGDHPTDYVKVDPTIASHIAQEYEQMPHDPHHPDVASAYDALKRETLDQYQHAVNNGYSFDFYPHEDPYPNSPREAVLDLHKNKHMYVYPTVGENAGFGSTEEADHPLLDPVPGLQWGGKQVTHNDLLRAIHDFYGHAKEGLGFRADGEDNAYRQHAAMFSPEARRALASETRAQNSWVNYGPHGEHNQTATADTIYAPQKAGLLPEWVSDPNLHAQTPVTASEGWEKA